MPSQMQYGFQISGLGQNMNNFNNNVG